VKVIINNQDVTVFNGARVCDAVLAFSRSSYDLMKKGRLNITDQYGHLTSEDGALAEGQVIRIQKKTTL